MKNIIQSLAMFFAFWAMVNAQVHYDKGRLTIDKVQLLQDYNDSLAYYYIPTYPRLAINEQGDFEFLCMKYVGKAEKDNGGLFHALFEFRMEDKELQRLEKKLQAKVRDAVIKGPYTAIGKYERRGSCSWRL